MANIRVNLPQEREHASRSYAHMEHTRWLRRLRSPHSCKSVARAFLANGSDAPTIRRSENFSCCLRSCRLTARVVRVCVFVCGFVFRTQYAFNLRVSICWILNSYCTRTQFSVMFARIEWRCFHYLSVFLLTSWFINMRSLHFDEISDSRRWKTNE